MLSPYMLWILQISERRGKKDLKEVQCHSWAPKSVIMEWYYLWAPKSVIMEWYLSLGFLMHQILYSLTVEAWVRAPLFVAKALSPCHERWMWPLDKSHVTCFSLWDIRLWPKQEFTKHWRIGAFVLATFGTLATFGNTQYVNKPRPTYSMIRYRVMRDTQSVPLNHVTATCQTVK